MGGRPLLFRFLALAAFLVTVALALWLAELRPLFVGIVMALALGLAWMVEWLAWRGERLESRARMVGAAPAPAPASEPELERDQAETAPAAEADAPEPEPAQPPPAPTPSAERAFPFVRPQAPRRASPEERPQAEPPAREPLRPVPPPASEPEPEPEEPAAAESPPAAPAPGAPVVQLPRRAPEYGHQWNLWDLERIAREDARREPHRRGEFAALFIHLRQFATADGTLPSEFDSLVRESFSGLLDRARGA